MNIIKLIVSCKHTQNVQNVPWEYIETERLVFPSMTLERVFMFRRFMIFRLRVRSFILAMVEASQTK